MLTGAEILGASAAALSLAKAGRSCLALFRETQQNTPQNQHSLILKLEIETIRFREWCAELNLLGVHEPTADGDIHSLEDFQRALDRNLRFQNPRMAQLAMDVLEEMQENFKEARKRCRAEAPSATSQSNLRHQTPGKLSSRLGQMFHFKRGSRAEHQIGSTPPLTTTASSLEKLTQIRDAARWLAWDKKVFLDLLVKVGTVNNSLLAFLPKEAQDAVSRRVHLGLLAAPQLDPETADAALPDSELTTLARVREQVPEDAETEPRPGENPQARKAAGLAPFRPKIYPESDFEFGTLVPGDTRNMSKLDGTKPVLVEWKYYGKDMLLDQFLRQANLIALLSNNDVFQKFRTLRCIGLVNDTNDNKSRRIGLIFESPGSAKASPAQEMSTLQDLIDTAEEPELGERFRLARDLSLAVYNLQSVQWLHKSIRSDNIVYIRPRPDASKAPAAVARHRPVSLVLVQPASAVSPIPETDEETIGSLSKEPSVVKIPDVYLIGWEFSRPDDPSEISETLSISTDGYRLRKDTIRLYSHPALLPPAPGAIWKRPRYTMEHDVYSFGLILLEIGLWKTLDSLRRPCATDAEFRQKLAGEYCDRLLAKMGKIYWDVTRRCILNHFDVGLAASANLAVEDPRPLPFAFSERVVRMLEQCTACFELVTQKDR